MTRIRCRETGCLFNRTGFCTSDEIEYDPDAGCLTMEPRDEIAEEEEEWEEKEVEEGDFEEGELEEGEEEWNEDQGYLGSRSGRRGRR